MKETAYCRAAGHRGPGREVGTSVGGDHRLFELPAARHVLRKRELMPSHTRVSSNPARPPTPDFLEQEEER
jgi:hypothetical protein